MDQASPGSPSSAVDGSVFLARTRALAPMLAGAADQIEERRELPASIVSALIENGLFRLLQPHFLGGVQLDPMAFVEVIEEVAKHDASTAWCLCQGNGCSMISAFLEPKVAQEIFGPADGIVAWGPAGRAELHAVPGGYRLTGRWSFATGSHHATWLGAHVPVLAADGTQLRRPDGGEVLRTLLFPKTNVKMTDIWRVVGLRGTGSDAFSAEDLFVPESHTVLRGPESQPRQPGRLYAFSSGNLYAAGFAGVALGTARGTLDAFIALARDKVPQGSRRALRESQVVQSQVAQAEARLGSARMFLLSSLGEIWEAVGWNGEVTLAQNARIRLASTWAIQQAREVVTTLYHAAGATAIFDDNPFERRFRDMHTAAQQAQGRPAHFETVGRILLGLEPDATMFTF
jgi:alkylation response protein AidB-like acyl-CoA dehydrogenase